MIFPWLVRHLPGPKWLRVLQILVLIGLAVFALFEWVFPALDGVLSEPTVESSGELNIGSNLLIEAEGQS